MSAKDMRKLMESVELTEGSVYEEAKFIAVMTWFMAESGMPGKHNAADILKEKYPEVTPWEWKSGFRVYLKAQQGK